MASQRPAWFRLSSVMRPPAPPPAPTPAAPTPAPNLTTQTPFSTIVRPSIPIRRPLVPNQDQEPAPPPPTITSAPPPPNPAPSTATPRTPVQTPAPPAPAPRSPVQTPALPQRSPVQTPAPTQKPPVQTPSLQPMPPAQTPAFQPRPPVQTPTPPPRSPVQTPAPTLWSPVQAPAPPPRSPVVTPMPAQAPPRSPVSPPTPTRSPSVTPARDVAPPPSPPRAPQRSPTVRPTSPPKAYSVSNSPNTKTQSTMPNSPVSRNVLTTSPKETIKDKANLPPMAYPKAKSPERTHMQSPKFKPLARSPSPFTLPPAQMNETEPKIEQKTVLVQKTIDKPMRNNVPHGNGNAFSGKREPVKHENGGNKKVSSSGMRVITLAGENKGAVMELTPSRKTNYSMGNPRYLNKSNTKEGSTSGEGSGSESGEEGKSRNGKTNSSRTMQSPRMNAYLNSNVQGVNNSILCNFTSTHNDPGIHLSLNRKANGIRYLKE